MLSAQVRALSEFVNLRSRPPLPTPENFDVTQTWGGPGTGLCLPRDSGHREPCHCDRRGQESERVGGSPGLGQGREVAQPRAHCPQHILLLSAQLFTIYFWTVK